MASFATQAYLYRRMTGDERFREYEQAALDWLFGTNLWGVSMIIGYRPHPLHRGTHPQRLPGAKLRRVASATWPTRAKRWGYDVQP